jgi:hypothetical protein
MSEKYFQKDACPKCGNMTLFLVNENCDKFWSTTMTLNGEFICDHCQIRLYPCMDCSKMKMPADPQRGTASGPYDPISNEAHHQLQFCKFVWCCKSHFKHTREEKQMFSQLVKISYGSMCKDVGIKEKREEVSSKSSGYDCRSLDIYGFNHKTSINGPDGGYPIIFQCPNCKKAFTDIDQ